MLKTANIFLKCLYSEERKPFERHIHHAYEVVFIKEGTVKFIIGERSYTASANSLLFIGKSEEHCVQLISNVYRRIYILLTPDQLNVLLPEFKLKSVFINRPENFCHHFDMNACGSETEAFFDALWREYQQPNSYSKEKIEAIFRLLIIHCYRLHREQFPIPTKTVKQEILDMQQYIDMNFAENIRLSDLENRFFLSSSHLAHEFKKWTGHSPKNYMMHNRLAYAKELLVTTELSIGNIASKAGFTDLSNFIRIFRMKTGKTPGKYRDSTGE
ncbi:MAG: AraC family transcriptional regulator [Oscillospiraceae bacterium]|jgi:AraC-like DNA-binding protein|nr:AraC family transcriptional regulator [Oscillospiraceae bacterium]